MDTLPQLDHTTYLSQLFWLFLSFGCFYFALSKAFLPKMADLLRHRRHYMKNLDHQIKHLENDLVSVENKKAEEINKMTELVYSLQESSRVQIQKKKEQSLEEIKKFKLQAEKRLRDSLQSKCLEIEKHSLKTVDEALSILLKKFHLPSIDTKESEVSHTFRSLLKNLNII